MILPEFFAENFNQFLLTKQNSIPFIWMLSLGLIGGLLSSLSPCVLSLLPLNLAYIGTIDIEDRRQAFNKAILFVLGVSLVLSLLGAFSSLAFAVFSEFRSALNIGIGVFIIFMAIMVLGWIELPLPRFFKEMPQANPFVIGLIFALISSPCSSPVLFGVLSMASTAGSVAASVLVMFFYSLGYTAIIFFASLSVGLMKQLDWFKQNHLLITRISAAVLAIAGIFYLYLGLQKTFLN
ncbi:MAG: cytochrome c biogenesis protein CcdA [Candidatus Caenarcaniphilales bacterium]|nr:cytochrome c biogenesis protein CcdA [Candidatus Caenarcaniphilales bacterium]